VNKNKVVKRNKGCHEWEWWFNMEEGIQGSLQRKVIFEQRTECVRE
jgi:hypothetical protein